MAMRVACVTGSSSGIGAATAAALAEAGFAVVVHGNQNLLGLSETVEHIRNQCPQANVRCVVADLTDPFACRDLVNAVFAWHGKIDAWVNNAGADILTGGAWQLPFDERLRRLWEVDVVATIRLSRLVASKMLQVNEDEKVGMPCLVNLSWDQARLGMKGEAGQLFGTAKLAIEGFTLSLAQTVGARMRVNLVAPGWIRTAWGEEVADSKWDRIARADSLSGRWGEPTDVAQTIAWLVSDQARFINGQRVEVNGGRRFGPPPPTNVT